MRTEIRHKAGEAVALTSCRLRCEGWSDLGTSLDLGVAGRAVSRLAPALGVRPSVAAVASSPPTLRASWLVTPPSATADTTDFPADLAVVASSTVFAAAAASRAAFSAVATAAATIVDVADIAGVAGVAKVAEVTDVATAASTNVIIPAGVPTAASGLINPDDDCGDSVILAAGPEGSSS